MRTTKAAASTGNDRHFTCQMGQRISSLHAVRIRFFLIERL
jgi:hypothetical protein